MAGVGRECQERRRRVRIFPHVVRKIAHGARAVKHRRPSSHAAYTLPGTPSRAGATAIRNTRELFAPDGSTHSATFTGAVIEAAPVTDRTTFTALGDPSFISPMIVMNTPSPRTADEPMSI